MNWSELRARRDAAFTEPAFRLGDIEFLKASAPPEIGTLVNRSIDCDEDDAAIDEHGEVAIFCRDADYRCLMNFQWNSIGPMVWEAGIDAIETDDKTYFCVWGDMIPHTLVAVASSRLTPAVAQAFVRSYLSCNGDEYGQKLFGSLPSDSYNYASDLIPTDTVMEAYFGFMGWCVVHFDSEAWSNLEESVVSRVVEPDPARRARDCLERMKSKDFWRSASAAQDEGEDPMPLEQKLALFERYFALSYCEP